MTFFYIRVQYFRVSLNSINIVLWINSVLCHASSAEFNSEKVLLSSYQRTCLYGVTCQWFKEVEQRGTASAFVSFVCVRLGVSVGCTAAYQNSRQHPKFGNRSANSENTEDSIFVATPRCISTFFIIFWLRAPFFITDLLLIELFGVVPWVMTH